ncbi:MAG TPA: tRNA (adenosine(37)-N6)-threonylcarbamoyltransferase complex transferase subunit TsaD [Fimbriimonadaceae bacterium]|nr:tRNA (adenosine(37)-N6)-threonylcarbamoyltransferase complex transferase subunit TsaD [Fimbriimonadaceae bacterium]HRJ33808.1 tRNA (adenosine(37)-N6)-threonylcarbamoyltransferase complex transferase subunit TsaD [Fimbriimonadaceae bacterium]
MSLTVLGIESSCDETSAAVVRGHHVLSNVVASQMEMHQIWGGVVPEAAARAHVESIVPVIHQALNEARVRPNDLDGIGVTHCPGLVGALSVGVTAAKTLSLVWGKPLVGVHHLHGHLVSPRAVLADSSEPERSLPFPYLALLVSGGHTELVEVRGPLEFQLLGQTIDDAAGEAFDKGARLLGLGYPGGRAIQERARTGRADRYSLPRALRDDPTRFSFSGLKTAVLRLVEKERDRLDIDDAAASLQQAIVDALAQKTLSVLESGSYRALTLVGGVAANELLRETLRQGAEQLGARFACPPLSLCTDNAAMIALVAEIRLAQGERDDLSLDCASSAPI